MTFGAVGDTIAPMIIAKWILKDGAKRIECTSFPYAFRSLWGIRHKGLNPKEGEPKRELNEMMKSLSIIGPVGTPMEKTLSFTAAVQKARECSLLDNEGNINGREFKRHKE